MLKKRMKWVIFIFACFLAAIFYIANVVLWQFENEISTFLSPAIVDTESLEVSSSQGQAMASRIMEEGATLLQNKDNTLPLDYSKDKKVNVFGWRSVDWIYGSEGQNASGGVAPEDDDFSKNVDLFKALNKYGIQYNERLEDMYYDYVEPDHQSADLRGQHISNLIHLREPNINDKKYYTDDLLSYSKDFSDVAIVVIGRMAGEGMNASTSSQSKEGSGAVSDNTRHYLEISTEEEALLTYVGKEYEKVIVLLNVSNPFECGFLETIPGIDACLYIGFTGTRAASALPKLLYGEVSPSGHTVDTFAYDMFTNPANIWAGQMTYTDYSRGYSDYVENIYVGYRWYETADAEGYWDPATYKRTIPNGTGGTTELTGYDAVVQFPFGYGGSYNTYEWTVGEISLAPGSNFTDETVISIPVTVKNTGEYPGRDVVSVYVTPPYTDGGIEKSAVSMVGFTKTNLLQPGTEETVIVEINPYDFASYDCYDKNENGHKGYELEAGKYTFTLRTDSHTVKEVAYNNQQGAVSFEYNVAETIKITNDPVTGSPVGNLFTGEDAVDTTPLDAAEEGFDPHIPWLTRESFMTLDQIKAARTPRAATPSAKINPGNAAYREQQAKDWDNATVDAFGDPVENGPVTWGANHGMKLAENGVITELGKKLGADFNAEEWDKVLEQLSINDVVRLINNYYGTKEIDSVGKPELKDLDGPAQIKGFSYAPRGTGYPTMVVLASTWNPKLAYEFGKSYGDDMKSLGVKGLWGWAIDNHRTAFFGRNHESPSEDAQLSGTMIANAVKGLNTRGRYCFIKHFALYGCSGDSHWLTEQAFRENYLKAYRKAFVDGGALGAMTTYQGNGAEHSETTTALLTGVLRKEWQFKGAITTDYISNDSYCEAIIRAGGNLGMGVNLKPTDWSYDSTTSLRFQNRLKEVAHEVLYTWLHADYNEQQYLANPDENDTFLSSTSINAWVWWKPIVYSIDVCIGVGIALWAALLLIGVFMPDKKIEE